MEIIRLFSDDKHGRKVCVDKAVTVLRGGGIVMHETETCYGLAADIFNKEALEKVYKMKQMRRDKPISIMVSDFAEAKQYGKFGQMATKLAQRFWPGPLTLLVPRTERLPVYLNRGNAFIGIRCPLSELSRDMVVAFGSPLTTTSANISGVRQAYDVMNFLHQMHNAKVVPDLILDAGKIPETPPSTILKIKGEKVEFIRKGELSYQVKAVIE